MGVRKPSWRALAGVLVTALAAWTSLGSLTLAAPDPGAPRIGLLPPLSWLLVLAVLGGALATWRPPSRRQELVLALPVLVLLPWLPVRVPAAALIWTGRLRLALWVGVASVLAAPALRRNVPAGLAAAARDPRRAPWLAAAIAGGAFLTGAWQLFPRLPGGDEPHYLIITQSLLDDHDLQIENNHRQGGYRAYYDGELKPDYLRRGTNGQIYSIHAPGLPALIAPVFALFGYPGVVVALALAGGLATALAWIAAWRASGDAAATWFGWAAVSLSAPFFFQTFMVFPDGPGAALVMAAVLALMAGPTIPLWQLGAVGTGLALLPWLHTRFAILAVFLGAFLIARQFGSPRFLQRTATFLAVPVVSAAAWFWFFLAIYGTPNPAAPYGGYTQSAVANLPRGVTGLLFDQQFGLIPNAPVYVCAILGLGAMARKSPRLTTELLVAIVPYGLAAAAYQMWWAGYSTPARFLVPVLLPLAIPAALWFAGAGRAARVCGTGALLVSLLLTCTLAAIDHGTLLFNVRDGAARWLLWVSPLVNLTTAMPSAFQNPPTLVVLDAAVWAAALGLAWRVGASLSSRRADAQSIAAAVMLAAALGGMAAAAIVWRANRASPLTPTLGSIELLHRYQADDGQLGVRYSPLRRVPIPDVPSSITIAAAVPALQPRNQPVLVLARPAAATYEIEADVTGVNGRAIVVSTDRQFRPGWAWNISDVRGIWRQTVTLPIPVRELVVDADPATRRAIDRLSIRAVAATDASRWPAGVEPVHTARYGPSLVSLLEGRAYMEPGGTWVAGDRRAEFAVALAGGSPIHLFVRNAPIDNEVALETDGWRQTLTMKSREERMVDVPVEPGRASARLFVTTARGARPSDFAPGSDDRRLLGCWIETR